MVDENEIKGTVTDGVGKLKDAAGGLTGDASLQADGKLDQLQGKVQAEYGEYIDAAKEQFEEATTLVRDQPLAAIGIGVGIGFLLGWLLTPAR
jgi:uncharacterized protein YjbJ (UPF0337 family)